MAKHDASVSLLAPVTHKKNARGYTRKLTEDLRIAFGDSYTYVQGVYGRQNYSFIGDYLPGNFAYDKETLLTNQIVQNFTGTAEGGPNWLQYLTGCGLEPGLTSPLSCDLQLWDFAFAGADVSTEL